MNKKLHLIKLSVGSESVESLAQWQAERRAALGRDCSLHITRMWPKRTTELLAGGSIYWVIKGVIQCRQRLLRFDEITGDDGIRRCGFVLDPALLRTTQALRRPFQGWRYLAGADAPSDLPKGRQADTPLPNAMAQELDSLGLR